MMINPGTLYSYLVIQAVKNEMERLPPDSMMYTNYKYLLKSLEEEDSKYIDNVDVEDPDIRPFGR